MTETISVPRDLLLELRDSANDCYNNEVRRYKDDRRRIIYKALVDKADELLAAAPKAVCPKCFDLTGCPSCAPAVEVEGLHPLIETLRENGGLIACRVDVAQQKVIIDQQAARIAELQLDADRYRWLRERGDAFQWENILRFDLDECNYADNAQALDAAIDAAMGGKGE